MSNFAETVRAHIRELRLVVAAALVAVTVLHSVHAECAPNEGIRLAIWGWPPWPKTRLFMAMQRGIAVFGLRNGVPALMEGCWIRGRYEEIDVDAQREVAALSAPSTLGPRLEYFVVATTRSWRTLVPTESSLHLEGSCNGATHTVRMVNVGRVHALSLERVPEEWPRAPAGERADAEPLLPIDLVLEPLSMEFNEPGVAPEPILPRRVLGSDATIDDGICTPGDRRECAERCAGGNARSCYNLALSLGYGAGYSAVELLRTACDAGVSEACNGLAWSLVSTNPGGPAGARRLQDAAHLFDRACSGGVARACAETRSLFRRVDDSTWYERARPSYERGCRGGDASSCRVVAEGELDRRAPRRRSNDNVRDLLERACRSGVLGSCERWAKMLEDDRGNPGNVGVAEDLYRFACSRGSVWSCFLLRARGVEDTGN